MTYRSNIDWAEIRRDHALGICQDDKANARRNGVAYSAYRRHRDNEGWARDLQPAVVKATTAALIKAAGERAVQASAEEAKQDVVAVQAAAAENVTVITRHRGFAGDLFTLAQGIGIELSGQSTLDLPARITCLDRLARTVATIVTIERQAHGLDSSQPVPKREISDEVLQQRMQSLLGMAPAGQPLQ